MKARRAMARVHFRDIDLSGRVVGFTYTDNTDKTDDISVTLTNRDRRLINDLFPERGEKIRASIEVENWMRRGDDRSVNLGEFEIDSVSGISVVTIGAVAVPVANNIRDEKKNRGWRSISLSRIAADIAAGAGLTLVYDTDFDPFYDTIDQNGKSNLSFLEELSRADGLRVKVTDGQLIVYEESKYEQKPAVATLTNGVTNFYGEPQFRKNLRNIYTACEIMYFDSRSDVTRRGFFQAPNATGESKILRLRENAGRQGTETNLDRRARTRLREQNKDEWTGRARVQGDLIYFAGVNINYADFGAYDGKYHTTSCSHAIGGGGYKTTLNTRRVLEGY
ncbi:MAG: hypothetical protein FWB75_04820 [Oscillospiraceae bacterium]|nr:hypothetical protein [Oscillospiraceae bacterium]